MDVLWAVALYSREYILPTNVYSIYMVAASLPIIYLNIVTILCVSVKECKNLYAVKLGINMKGFSLLPYERAETDLDNNFQLLYIFKCILKKLKWYKMEK